MADTVGIGDPINEVAAAHYQKHPEQWQHKPCAREHEPGYVCVRLDGHDRQPAPSLGAGDVEDGWTWHKHGPRLAHLCDPLVCQADFDLPLEPPVHVLTDADLAAHGARASTADRERVVRVEQVITDWEGDLTTYPIEYDERGKYAAKCLEICIRELRAALAAPHVEPSP